MRPSSSGDCCGRFETLAAEENVPCGYSSEDREWWLQVLNIDPEDTSDWRRPSALQLIDFCPFCAMKYPTSLGDEWFDTLKSMGLNDPTRQEIPEEFRSDQWWKERGL